MSGPLLRPAWGWAVVFVCALVLPELRGPAGAHAAEAGAGPVLIAERSCDTLRTRYAKAQREYASAYRAYTKSCGGNKDAGKSGACRRLEDTLIGRRQALCAQGEVIARRCSGVGGQCARNRQRLENEDRALKARINVFNRRCGPGRRHSGGARAQCNRERDELAQSIERINTRRAKFRKQCP